MLWSGFTSFNKLCGEGENPTLGTSHYLHEEKEATMLNPDQVKSDEELAVLLGELGFDSEPLPENWKFFRESVPARIILRTESLRMVGR